jgi:hypothetical protein
LSWRAVFITSLLATLVTRNAAADSTHTCVEAAHEGQRLRDGGKLSGARDAFVLCSAVSCPALVRESCERWSAEIEPRLPTIVLGARDEAGNDLTEVRVSIDGRSVAPRLDGRSIALDPGPHDVVFEAEGFSPARQFLVAREGERVRGVVAVLSKRAPASASSSPPAIAAAPASAGSRLAPLLVAGGVGALGLAGFVTFGLWGKGEHDRLSDSCAGSKTCARADVRDVETKYLVADISLVVGVVATSVLAYLLVPLLVGEPSSKKSALSIDAAPVRGGACGGVTYGF